MIAALMRYYSCLFHGVLTLFLLLVSGSAMIAGARSLRLDMLPWSGSTLTYVVFWSALFGLASVILALTRKLPALLFLWSLAVTAMLIWGYLFTQYGFARGELPQAVLLVAGAAIAIPGPWFQMREPSA